MRIANSMLALLLLSGCATTGASRCVTAGGVAGVAAQAGGWVAAGLPGPLALVGLPIVAGSWLVEYATRGGCEAAETAQASPAPTEPTQMEPTPAD